jgi:membrane protein involved in colicin uptake
MPDPVTHLDTPEEAKRRKQEDAKRAKAALAEAEKARAAAMKASAVDTEKAEAELAEENIATTEADQEASRVEEVAKALEDAEVEADPRMDAIDPSNASAQVINEFHSRQGNPAPSPTSVARTSTVGPNGTVTEHIDG